MKGLFFFIGLVILIGIEIGRVFFIMPFPGSQESNTIEIAYFIHSYINYFRVLGIILIAYPVYHVLNQPKRWIKVSVSALLIFWIVVAFMFNFRLRADKMFYQPETKSVVEVSNNKVPVEQLVLGVALQGESKAYPIEIIGYHHQVRDTIGGELVMVTYCTVCRTGRVFRPIIKGENDVFRLVGMDHYNAMFEDSRTGSWWRQVSGEAITGPLKGQQLEEVFSEQMTLSAWIDRHPETKILQEDSIFKEAYIELKDYDEGKKKGRLEGTDSVSWRDKSWVVGIQVGVESRAYDWIELLQAKIINDKVGLTPVVVAIEKDSATFHVWQRPDSLQFTSSADQSNFVDDKTGSKWNWNGTCVEGRLAGAQLSRVQSYQEYWHSWRTFHPQTTQYKR